MAIYSLFALSVIIETKSMESNTWNEVGTVAYCADLCRILQACPICLGNFQVGDKAQEFVRK